MIGEGERMTGFEEVRREVFLQRGGCIHVIGKVEMGIFGKDVGTQAGLRELRRVGRGKKVSKDLRFGSLKNMRS